MRPDRRLRAPELVRPRLEVLKTGLERLEKGEEEGRGTVRRIGRVFLSWAIGEGLEEIQEAAFQVVGSKESEILEAGHRLRELLEGIQADLGPGDSEQFVILAVEENPEDAALLELALSSVDRTVHVVPTVAEAQGILDEEAVALLVLDLFLPDTDGRGLLAQVRDAEEYKDLAVFVVSGKGTPEVEAECLALGANAFFHKPLDPTALAAAASSALHREAKRRLSAHSDPLTHLLNRRSLMELWERWTFPEPSSIGILGIDRFRALEERFDHEIADSVIASVGGFLRDSVPRGSVAARWEEADFLVLFPGLDRDMASDHLRKLLEGIRGLEQKDPAGEVFQVTVSGGVVEILSGSTFDNAVEEAYALLERATESGGNTLAESVESEEDVTILLAEDDVLSAAILQHRLEREGFRILHFPDGNQALEGALSNRVDFAILDVKMPGMDGFELLQRLRKTPAYYELPIMMLTSMGREEDIARGFELGADDYMVKPFSPVEVLARIGRLLKR